MTHKKPALLSAALMSSTRIQYIETSPNEAANGKPPLFAESRTHPRSYPIYRRCCVAAVSVIEAKDLDHVYNRKAESACGQNRRRVVLSSQSCQCQGSGAETRLSFVPSSAAPMTQLCGSRDGALRHTTTNEDAWRTWKGGTTSSPGRAATFRVS